MKPPKGGFSLVDTEREWVRHGEYMGIHASVYEMCTKERSVDEVL